MKAEWPGSVRDPRPATTLLWEANMNFSRRGNSSVLTADTARSQPCRA